MNWFRSTRRQIYISANGVRLIGGRSTSDVEEPLRTFAITMRFHINIRTAEIRQPGRCALMVPSLAECSLAFLMSQSSMLR